MTIPSSMKKISLFTGPRKIFFGLNSLEKLSEELRALNANNLLILTDPNMVRLGYVDRIVTQLDDVRVKVFSKVEREPFLGGLEELAARVREQNYDAILALGGGSVIDSAKVASFSAKNSGPISHYVGVDKVRKKGLPLICVPTTSGTGSEVTRFAVIKHGKTKKAVVSDLIIPDIAIVDPVLSVSMPQALTAHTGLDALAHAAEAMISTWATPFTDVLALGAIKWVFHYLKRAYINGDDLEARYHMSIAATMAGLSFNDPRVILAHSIGQTIGPIYNIPHGVSVALTLPYMLDFYLATSANKIAMMSKVAGLYNPEKTEEENAKALIEELFQFYRELSVPLSLKELGVPLNALEKLAQDTITSQPRNNSPIKFTKENILNVYDKMWKGMERFKHK